MSASSTSPTESGSFANAKTNEAIQSLCKLFQETGCVVAKSGFILSQMSHYNTFQHGDFEKTRAELRTSEKRQAVMEDALSKMQAELLRTRSLLDSLWTLLQTMKAEIPDCLTNQYRALTEGDSHDAKPAFDAMDSNPGETDTKQTIKADAKEDQHGKRAHPLRLLTISPTVRINGEFADTQLSQAAAIKSSAATEPLVSKEGAAGTKRGALDGDLNTAKRLKTERDLNEINPGDTAPDVKIKTEGECEKENVRVKSEE